MRVQQPLDRSHNCRGILSPIPRKSVTVKYEEIKGSAPMIMPYEAENAVV
jgi:hypothetical protein